MKRQEVEHELVRILNGYALTERECEAIREAIKRVNDLYMISGVLDQITDEECSTYGHTHAVYTAHNYAEEH